MFVEGRELDTSHHDPIQVGKKPPTEAHALDVSDDDTEVEFNVSHECFYPVFRRKTESTEH
ncbi:UNVERIFIED_CONTAM: hypothetical protein NCL1_22928 [Trichonephila clavipes]